MHKIIGLLLFILAIFIFDRLGGIALKQLLSESGFRYVRMYEGKDRADIVVIGNSRGVNGFYVPYLEEQLGTNVANISFNGLKTELAVNLLNDYIDKHQPKLILFEGSMLFNSPCDTALLRDFKLYTHYSARISNLLKSQAQSEYLAATWFHLYKFNTPFFFRNLFYFRKNDKNWINNYQLSSKLVEMTKSMEPLTWQLNPSSLDLFKKYYSDWKQKGITTKIVISPYLPIYRDKITNFDTLVQQMQEITSSPIYDYSDYLSEQKYFGDRVHSNKNGAILLGDKMIKDNVFKWE